MRYIFVFIILLSSYSYSSYAHPWIPNEGKYEIFFSNSVYFTEYTHRVSRLKYLVQKDIAQSLLKLKKTESRKEKKL